MSAAREISMLEQISAVRAKAAFAASYARSVEGTWIAPAAIAERDVLEAAVRTLETVELNRRLFAAPAEVET